MHGMRSAGRAGSERWTGVAAVVAALVALVIPFVAVAGTGAETRGAEPLAAPPLTAETFADPPATVRPKYRWWMPLAYTDDDQLAAELRQMAEAGAGGAEVAAFQVQGKTDDSEFLEQYGWGTPLWAHKVETMFAAAKDNGLRLDLTIGPRWPATVPTITDINDPRANQQLIFSHEFHAGGASRDGALPANFNVTPPAGADKTLVAALVARCTDSACDSQSSSPRRLEQASVDDVTSQVDAEGDLHYEFPGDAGTTYALIAFYQTAAGNSLSGYTATGRNYEVDHLSVAGAKASTDYYDEHILTPGVRRLIGEIGDADLYEDSLEIGNSQKWTWEFAQEWQRRRGYSVVPVLPALAGIGAQGITASPFFDFADGAGARIRTDYRQTWSDLYIENRLETFDDWTETHGMQTRIQPYGHPVDTAGASSHIDVPEGESLAFGDDGSDGKSLAFGDSFVEDYKVVAVGAHMTDRPVVSSECCAHRGAVWATTAAGGGDAANLRAVYNGLAGGVTQIVWHGFPYLTRGPVGSGSQALWPGMSYGGNTSFAEAFGAKGSPSWSDYRKVNDHLARLQLVLRQGTPRFDVGVYWHDFGLDGHGTTGVGSDKLVPSSSAMAAAGYTYEYVSPEHLRSAAATFRGGALFPEHSAYKALVLNDQSTMPVDVARRILDRAEAGLPVVIIGALPRTTPGYRDAADEDAELRALIDRLVAQPTVERVASEADVPAALGEARIRPAVAHGSRSSAILGVRRHTDVADYYFLFNQTPTAEDQTLTLTGDGVPYRLDTWTGEVSRIADYRREDGTVTVPVHLHGNDTEVIAVAPRGSHAFGGAREPRPAPAPAATARLAPRTLTDWSLTVDSWTPGPSGLPGDTSRTTLGPVTPEADADGRLPAWTSITPANGYSADLQDASGVGTYTTHVTLGPEWSPVHGTQLDLGRVIDTSSVTVNGRMLPPLNYADLEHIEVGPYLRNGLNTITVRVASTLLNAVRVAPGTGASARERMDYGLIGPVTLTPVTPVAVEPLEKALPLAAGGFNRARIRVTNNASDAQEITIGASAPAGVTARPDRTRMTVGGGESVTVGVDLRNTGLSSGTSALEVRATGDHGAEADTTVGMRHSDDLARNDLGTPFPRVFATSNQDRYPPALVSDGSPSSFWVSGGQASGQGPSPDNPVDLGVDLGAATAISAVTTVGRSTYGPRSYQIQTSADGRAWTTAATVADAPRAGTTTTVPTIDARYVRLRITDSWDPLRPPRNVQMPALEVRAAPPAPPEPTDNRVREATLSASSSHPAFPVSTLADGETDQSPWCSGQTGRGWNDATKSAFPDDVTATFPQAVELGRAVVFTLDRDSCPYGGVSDFDVQVSVGGEWRTVDSVRDNRDARVESTFPAVSASALRIVVHDSTDHDYSRLVEVEAYGASS